MGNRGDQRCSNHDSGMDHWAVEKDQWSIEWIERTNGKDQWAMEKDQWFLAHDNGKT